MIENNEMLADRVLIEPITETVSAGGIIIPDSAKERPKLGKVILVGPGTKDVDMVLVPGQEVLFGQYAGIEIKEDGKNYLIMRQDDVFMKTKK